MKNVFLLILIATTIAFGQADNAKKGGGKQPASQAKVLKAAEFDALLSHPESLLIIDVRRPDEVKDIGGFPVYLSIQQPELEKSLAWIPKDRTIVTVSNHAARGGRAADILTKAGFKVAGTVGAQTYEEEGGKLTKIVPPPPNPNAKKQ
jgi:rhodanese-related sulfurtransferase